MIPFLDLEQQHRALLAELTETAGEVIASAQFILGRRNADRRRGRGDTLGCRGHALVRGRRGRRRARRGHEGERQQSELHFAALKRLLDRDEPGWSQQG